MSKSRPKNQIPIESLTPEANFLYQVASEIETQKPPVKGAKEMLTELHGSGTDAYKVDRIMAIVDKRLKEHQDKGEEHYKEYREGGSRGFPFYINVMLLKSDMEKEKARRQQEHKGEPGAGSSRFFQSGSSQSNAIPPSGAAPEARLPSFEESKGHQKEPQDSSKADPDLPPAYEEQPQPRRRSSSSGR